MIPGSFENNTYFLILKKYLNNALYLYIVIDEIIFIEFLELTLS